MATKKKGFKLFDMNRDGKGAVEENTKPTLAFFFKSLVRKFPQLLRLNLLMLFQILPLIFIAIVFLAGDKTPSATSTTYAPLLGIDQVLSTPSASHTLDMSLIQMGLPVFSTAVTCTIIVLVLFLLITWGWQNIGATYVLRGLVRGDAVFLLPIISTRSSEISSRGCLLESLISSSRQFSLSTLFTSIKEPVSLVWISCIS
ncbi:MAG: hypothetical protein J6M03_03400 [Clostridia bacterium]|nr:hypothetical protein [Clostridia bacterium]